MNRLAVSISILAVMAAGSAASVWATDKVASDMTKQISLAEQTFVSGDKEACVAHAERLSEIWDGVLKYTILITDAGHALEIIRWLSGLQEELYAACDRAQAQIRMFRDMQLPTLWKIL